MTHVIIVTIESDDPRDEPVLGEIAEAVKAEVRLQKKLMDGEPGEVKIGFVHTSDAGAS